MQTITRIADLREIVRGWRLARESIAFVPTMGNLHAGHASLIGAAHLHGRRVVASVFVNPLQFGPNEDFAAYPRTPRGRPALLDGAGRRRAVPADRRGDVSARQAGSTIVDVPELSGILCGAFRPGHFQGVATVVVKLLNLVQPDVAIFGEKDYQQLTIIRRVGRGPVPAGEDRRRADGACRGRPGAELAQPLPERRGARAAHRACTAHSIARAGASSRATPTSPASSARASRRCGPRASARLLRGAHGRARSRRPQRPGHRRGGARGGRLGRARLIDNVQCRAGA